ncbi:MAG TPA: hypothetical protein VFN30_04725 [Chitinophagaceae bacterium]|nr:hypothetical protein [Chitinophagaceae bacterium]
MTLYNEQIRSIQQKLQQVMKKQEAMQKENASLTEEITKYKNDNSELRHQLEVMELQVNILKTSCSQLEGEEKKEFEKKINFFIKEIDRCIALLSE